MTICQSPLLTPQTWACLDFSHMTFSLAMIGHSGNSFSRRDGVQFGPVKENIGLGVGMSPQPHSVNLSSCVTFDKSHGLCL